MKLTLIDSILPLRSLSKNLKFRMKTSTVKSENLTILTKRSPNTRTNLLYSLKKSKG